MDKFGLKQTMACYTTPIKQGNWHHAERVVSLLVKAIPTNWLTHNKIDKVISGKGYHLIHSLKTLVVVMQKTYLKTRVIIRSRIWGQPPQFAEEQYAFRYRPI